MKTHVLLDHFCLRHPFVEPLLITVANMRGCSITRIASDRAAVVEPVACLTIVSVQLIDDAVVSRFRTASCSVMACSTPNMIGSRTYFIMALVMFG